MTAFAEALGDFRRARTWTNRLYSIPPIVEQVIVKIRRRKATDDRSNAAANERMAETVASINSLALGVLDVLVGDLKVRFGPFAGMQYIRTSTGSLLGPKIVGTYEDKIHPWIEEAIHTCYDVVVDVGAAEGYYAAGFARAIPTARIFAYDLHGPSRDKLAELCTLNGVQDRVSIREFCTPLDLASAVASPGRCLIFVDIEGAEVDLLDIRAVPELAGADIIVELHEEMRPGTIKRFLERFKGSHQIDLTCAVPTEEKVRRAASFGVTSVNIELAVDEHRGLPQVWMRLRSLSVAERLT